jgi:hypothetical protein
MDEHSEGMLAACAAPLRILTGAVRREVVGVAAAFDAGCAIGQEADGVGQHKVQCLGEAVARHWHVCVLVELLNGLHCCLLEALLAGGGELAVQGVIPGHLDGGRRGLRGGRLWL